MLELMKKPKTNTGTMVIKSLMKEMSVKHKKRKKTIRHEPKMKMIAEIVYMYPVVPLQSDQLSYQAWMKNPMAIALNRHNQ